MMGLQNQQKELFGYNIDLDRRVRADNPLRKVAAVIDFSFARAEVQHTYGHNGNVSVDPVVILKMMFLLFFDNIASERELVGNIAERMDYLWFLGYGLNDVPAGEARYLNNYSCGPSHSAWPRASSMEPRFTLMAA